ncbi:hypothetical protein [Phaeovulum sp.]|uniref:hypothetical protein n=1 Tax=Phaeovulum sp. TaxID=2934796 RepID=UPI002730163E|nr:hypothetical protein [Phaeovulum sp.]MDP1668374.1 hypothetical protein [Phaeovulum sp.]MDZ4120131.1 hypothetical protein [Phaeovulum sp.]
MTGNAPKQAAEGKAARATRLAEALRANLLRRKAQARGRATAAADKNDQNGERQES